MADYAKKTNAELVEILKSRNLPHTGKKAEMVARLEENDAAAPAAAAPAATTENAEDVIDWEDDEVPTTASNTKPAETAPAPAAPAAAPTAAEPAQEAPKNEEKTEGIEAATTTESTEQQPAAEEKPVPNFSIGLSVTDLEAELKKRKARAEKFGITEDSQAAIDAAEKKLERAKRFGTAGEEETNAESVGRLDQALPERSRKRGRGEGEQGGRGGKRRNQGRNNNNNNNNNNNQRNRRGNKPQGQGQGQKGNQQKPAGTTNAASNGWSAKDKEAMEARKKRFAA
ncbi:SAP domain-containing protein [Aspergillus stella-maris]|uniref:SAP domain-containing protein n=1 Tax=Aspergillus stella-maris TaxID=1810926 RepID=UPI003CCD2DF7